MRRVLPTKSTRSLKLLTATALRGATSTWDMVFGEPLEHSVKAQNIMDQMTAKTDDRPCFGRGRELLLQLHDTVMEYRYTDVTGNLFAPEGVVRNVFDNVAGIRDTEDTQSVQRCLLVPDQLNYSLLVGIVPHLVLWLLGAMATWLHADLRGDPCGLDFQLGVSKSACR